MVRLTIELIIFTIVVINTENKKIKPAGLFIFVVTSAGVEPALSG